MNSKYILSLLVLSSATLSAEGRFRGSSQSGYSEDPSYYTSGDVQGGTYFAPEQQTYYSEAQPMGPTTQSMEPAYHTRPYVMQHDPNPVYTQQDPYYSTYPTSQSQGGYVSNSYPAGQSQGFSPTVQSQGSYYSNPYPVSQSQGSYPAVQSQGGYYNNPYPAVPSQGGSFYSETVPGQTIQHEQETHFYHPGYPASQQPDYYNTQSGFGQSFQAPRTQGDVLLEDKIQNEVLNDASNSFQFVGVSVSNNGTVTLTGLIATPEIRRQLKERIWRLAGVKSIDDRLDIKNVEFKNQGAVQGRITMSDFSKSAASETVSDAELMRKIDEILKRSRFTRAYKTVSFHVANGRVSLTGTVDDDAERKDVVDHVRNIFGVSSVSDQLQVLHR